MRRSDAGGGRGSGGGGIVRVPPPWTLKTELCNFFQSGSCQRGDRCWYAHGQRDLQRPALLTAAAARVASDPHGVALGLDEGLRASLAPLSAELAAAGGAAFTSPQRAAVARTVLAGALVLDAQVMVTQGLVGPPLDSRLRQHVEEATRLWAAANRSSAQAPPPPPPPPPPAQAPLAPQPQFAFAFPAAPPLPMQLGFAPQPSYAPQPGFYYGAAPPLIPMMPGFAFPTAPQPPPGAQQQQQQQQQQAFGFAPPPAGSVSPAKEAMAAIKQGDCARLAALLESHKDDLEEVEVYGLIWEAAVDTCSAPALKVLLGRYGHLEWTDLEDEDTDEDLVFCMVRRAAQQGWQRAEPVLRLLVEADPSVLHSRLPGDDMPLHLALSLRPLPPMDVVRLLAPEAAPEVWTASVQGLAPEELPTVWSYSNDSPADRHMLGQACAHLASLRQRQEEQQQTEAQRRVQEAAEQHARQEEEKRVRDEEARQARAAKQEADRRARLARQEAEQQARVAREEAARQAKQARQREAERQREVERRMQELFAAERLREQQALARARAERLQTREGKLEALYEAAQMGQVQQIRSLWQQLTLTRQEAEDMMVSAALHGCSWAGVQALAQLWDPQRHGDWCSIGFALDPFGPPTPLIFALVGDQEHNVKLWQNHEPTADMEAILREMLRRRPDLATLRDSRNLTPLGRAIVTYAPMGVIKALAPPTLLTAHDSHTGSAHGALTIVKCARDLARQYPRGNTWHVHFNKVAQYLEEGLQAQQEQRAAELQQKRTDLRAAMDAAAAAVHEGNMAELAGALQAVAHPKLKDVHDKVLPLGGLGPYFDGLLLKAPSMAVVSAIQEAGRPHHMRPLSDPAVSSGLLEAALLRKRFEMAEELLREFPAAVAEMLRPPVSLALQQDAPDGLVGQLLIGCQELRQTRGGALEVGAGVLPPAALAAERGRVHVLSQLLELGPALEFVLPTAQQPLQGRAQERKDSGRVALQTSTLLYHALAAGQEEAAMALLRHARRKLSDPARLASHVNLLCGGGCTALYRAVDKFPGSSLVTALLNAGADPSIPCQDGRHQSSAVHLAVQRGHSKLAQQLLKSLSEEKRGKLLKAKVAKGHTLLHLAVEAQDSALVGHLVAQGAPVLTQPIGSAPLLMALGQLEAQRAKKEQPAKQEQEQRAEQEQLQQQQAQQAPPPQQARQAAQPQAVQKQVKQKQAAQAASVAGQVCDELLRGWTADSLMRLLEADLEPAERQLVSSFVERHADTVLTPFLQGGRERKQRLLQLGLDSANIGLLTTLLAQPGISAQGLSLHAAFKWLPRPLLRRLVEAGSSVNQRDDKDGSLLMHKAVQAADLDLLDFLLSQPGANITAGDKQGNSLLHWSTAYMPANKREEVMRHLLQRAPRLLAVHNHSGQTAYDFAPTKQPKKILEKLEEELRESQPEVLQTALEAAAAEHGTSAAGGKKRAGPELSEDDLTRPGPKNEPDSRKRQRVEAMAAKLPEVLRTLRDQQAAQQAQQAAAQQEAATSGGGSADAGLVGSSCSGDGAPAQQDESGRLREVVQAAVEQTMPEAVPGQAEHTDDAFSDEEGEEAGAVGAELAAAAGAAALPADLDSLQALLAELPWEFTITRDAWHEWLGMDPNYRRMVLLRLQQIGRGAWGADGKTKRLLGFPPTLELWRTKLTKGGRIVFEVAADYSESGKGWRDMLRLWCITLHHKTYETVLGQVEDSHRKSQLVRDRVKLRPRPGGPQSPGPPTPGGSSGRGIARERLPTHYDAEEAEGGEGEPGPARSRPGSAAPGTRLYFPPASAGHNNYTLLKFYRLSSELVHAVMEGLDESAVDFSFRVSPAEQEIIEMVPHPPRTIILLGRSGTGKTTCAVFRMWAHWLTAWHKGEPFNQVFVTANATLQDQVAKSFCKLRNAVVVPELATVYAEAGAREYPTLAAAAVPPEAFPLFLSSRQFLRMLDGTVEETFFPRRADGSILWDRSEDDFDPDGMSVLVQLDAAGDLELEDEEDEEDDSGEDSDAEGELEVLPAGGRRGQAGGAGAGPARWKRQEVTYPIFQDMWKEVTTKELRAKLKAGLAWLEIISYIKGSAEAVRTPEGRLSLAQYLEIGRKRAPNFDSDSRRLVFQVCEAYQRFKRLRGRYDNADVVASVFRQLTAQGYRGVPIHSLYRDEVQDFTQAELLMDLRIVTDPNGLFLCGDTAQTIARGIGFRFTDIQTLFYEERRDQLAQEAAASSAGAEGEEEGGGRSGPGLEVHMPLIAHLKVNYRTHSGILDVASSLVDAMKRFFPQHIDHLDRERAFFTGPKPLLLSTVTTDDLAILLSWSDKATSQVEFGAHQVVLVRSVESVDRLPEGLRDSNALVLTVPQSKGLEFDDVFIVNFCTDSPVKDDWRILLQYLEELEQAEALHGAAALPSKRGLVGAEEAAAGIGELGRGALRPLAFDDAQHKVLCEELKHLYTAVTRAKNSVVIYDDNPTARAPLYFYLNRLGLARVVARSLMEEGVDTSDLGITQARSTPADWAQQGYNLLEKGVFDAAARCFERAGDMARAQYCLCRGRLSKARQQQETSPQEAKAAWFAAAYDLLALSVNAQPNPALLPPPAPSVSTKKGGSEGMSLEQERRLWAALAARAFQQAGDRELAVRLWLSLGSYKQARALLIRMDDPRRLADCCLAAANALKLQGEGAKAVPWLAAAVKQLRALQQWGRCLAVLEEDEGVRKKLHRTIPALLQDIGVNAMREIAAAPKASSSTAAGGDAARRQQRLAAASRLIQSHALRVERLEHFKCWAELAREVKDPLRAGQLLSEHANFPAAIARLLEAATAEKLPSSALKLLHRLVAAAGSPSSVAATWRLLQQVGSSSSLSPELPRMRADLAARLAHQLAGLHPLTSAPLPAAAASPAEKEAALTAAQQLADNLPGADASGSIIASDGVSGSSAVALAGRLAAFAQQAYQQADHALGELRCLAVAAAVGGPPMPAASLHRGLQLADTLLGRFSLAAGMSGVAGWRRRPTAGERLALLAVEELFHLSGLADPASTSGQGGGVTCPAHDPGLRALTELFASGAAQHGSQERVKLERRKLVPPAGSPSAAASRELLVADLAAVQTATAFYLCQLATAATNGLLGAAHGCLLAADDAAVAAPPGLAGKRAASQPTAAALEALGRQFRVLAQLQQVQAQARRVFPKLRLAAAEAGEGQGKGGDRDNRLLSSLLETVFPAGPVDSLPAALDVRRLLHIDRLELANLLRRRYLLLTDPHAYSPNPDFAFELWRSLNFLLRLDRMPHQAFKQAASAAAQRPKGSAELQLLIRIRGRREVPALLLVEASDHLQLGLASHAVDALLFYLERCWASSAAASSAAASSAAAAVTPLGAEQATWLLELLCGLASVSCLQEKQGVLGETYLPRAAADMLTQLPFVSAKHSVEDLRFHAKNLRAAAQKDAEKQHATWRRLACLLAVTVRSLIARLEAAGSSSSGSSNGGDASDSSAGAAAADSARALLGRLALAAGSMLASLAVRYQGAKELPAELPGSLYAALRAARAQLPALQQELQEVEEAKRVGELVGALHGVAKTLGTSLIQVTDKSMHEFDGLPKLPGQEGRAVGTKEEEDINAILAELDEGTAGAKSSANRKQQGKRKQQAAGAGRGGKVDAAQAKLLQLAARPVAFQERGLRAAPTSVRVPALDELQEYQPREDPGVHRAKAALVIQQAWRRCLKQRAHRRIMLVMKGFPFRARLRAWFTRAHTRQQQLAEEQAAQEEQDRLRAAALADAANAGARYDWVETSLGQSNLVAASQCPICQTEPPAGNSAAADAADPTAGSNAAAPAAGAGSVGLNAAAPSFLPHTYTDAHTTQAAAFLQYKAQYKEQLAPQLLRALELRVQLQTAGEDEYYVEALQFGAELLSKIEAAHAALAWYDSRRHWAEDGPLQQAAGQLAAACDSVSGWLESRAIAASEAAAPRGTYEEHEHAAAELQAYMAAAAAAQSQQADADGGGGWSTVGPGRKGHARAAMAELDELEDDEDDVFGGGNMYEALLDKTEAAGSKKGKRGSGGGKKKKKKKKKGDGANGSTG